MKQSSAVHFIPARRSELRTNRLSVWVFCCKLFGVCSDSVHVHFMFMQDRMDLMTRVCLTLGLCVWWEARLHLPQWRLQSWNVTMSLNCLQTISDCKSFITWRCIKWWLHGQLQQQVGQLKCKFKKNIKLNWIYKCSTRRRISRWSKDTRTQ